MSTKQGPWPNFQYCDAFWMRQELDRPLLAGWVGSFEVPTLYPNGLAHLPEGRLRPDDIQFETFRTDYENLFEQHSQVRMDVPWAAFPLLPVPWVEAILGCPIYTRGGNFRAEPWLDSYEAILDSGLEPDVGWLQKLLDFVRWLVKLSAGRFPVALSLMRGPADLLAAMRGAERSVYDLYDRPEMLKAILQMITDLWIDVARAQMACIPEFAGGYSFSIINLWGRSPGGWFQDDAIAYWSPSFYRQYARDCEARLSGWSDLTGIHLHSTGLFTVDDLVEMPELDVIEVNLDDVGLRIPQMIPWFQKILEKKRLYIWGALTEEDLTVLRANLPVKGLALQLIAETPERVQALIDRAKEIWQD